MSQGVLILSRLDDPWKIGPWEIDVFTPAAICILIGLLKGTGLALGCGFALGIFLSLKVSKLKAAQHPGFVKHFFYWHLPTLGNFNCYGPFPTSGYREMVG